MLGSGRNGDLVSGDVNLSLTTLASEDMSSARTNKHYNNHCRVLIVGQLIPTVRSAIGMARKVLASSSQTAETKICVMAAKYSASDWPCAHCFCRGPVRAVMFSPLDEDGMT